MLKAVKGEKGIVEPSFIYLPGVPGGDAIAKETGIDFFSTPVEFGVSGRISFCYFTFFYFLNLADLYIQPTGAEKAINVLTGVTEQEKKLLEASTKGLKGNVEKGIDFVKSTPPK